MQYHQGPEWGFPLGWFLQAWLTMRFDMGGGEGYVSKEKTLYNVSNVLLRLREHIHKDPWRGLPELCNHGKLNCKPPELTTPDGAYCRDSCTTQAWSASTILDVLEHMHKIGKNYSAYA